MTSNLLISIFVDSEALTHQLVQCLGVLADHSSPAQPEEPRWITESFTSDATFRQWIEQHKQQLDCLILQDGANLQAITDWLRFQGILLPLVIVEADPQATAVNPSASHDGVRLHRSYHPAEVWLSWKNLEKVRPVIHQAIADFLHLSPICQLTDPVTQSDFNHDLTGQNFLRLQQQRLTEKLRERLGYLGVYYKRDPKTFLRNLSTTEKEDLIERLREDYRDIILNYFLEQDDTRQLLNQKIDNLVNIAFFADISVTQIVEIHMELIDEFSKQLKLEGRSEDVLLDYRLTLIDTIAHLCEMYRRSIPRES